MNILRFLDMMQGDFGWIPVAIGLLIIAAFGDLLREPRDR